MATVIFSIFALFSGTHNLSVTPGILSDERGFLYLDPKGIGDRFPGDCLEYYSRAVPVMTVHRRRGLVDLSFGLGLWCFGTSPETGLFVGKIGHQDSESIHSLARCVSLEGVSTKKRLQVSVDALVGSSSAHKSNPGPRPNPGSVEWPSPSDRCAAIVSSMYSSPSSSERIYSLSGIGSRSRETEYWLDFCGIDIATVHYWEYGDYRSIPLMNGSLSYTSRCNIRKVTSPHDERIGRDYSANIACTEDFLDFLHSRLHFPGAQGEELVFFSSGLGPPYLVEPTLSDNLRTGQNLHEILAMVSAFCHSEYKSLTISYLWGDVVSVSNSAMYSPFKLSLKRLLGSFNYDETLSLFEELWDHYDMCLNHKASSHSKLCVEQMAVMLTAEIASIVQIDGSVIRFQEECNVLVCNSNNHANDVRDELSRFLKQVALLTLSYDSPFHKSLEILTYDSGDLFAASLVEIGKYLPEMCKMRFSSAQLILISRFLSESTSTVVPPVARIFSQSNQSSGDINALQFRSEIFMKFWGYVPNGPQRTMPSNNYDLPASFTTSVFDQVTGKWTGEIVNIKNSEGKVYVLAFLESDEDLGKARAIVQAWRNGCPDCRFNAVFTLYILPPCDSLNLSAPKLQCSLRHALLALNEWIITNTVGVDIVISVIGIEAMLALRHPGVSKSGIIPDSKYGRYDYYRLTTPISFAAKSRNGEPIKPNLVVDNIDFRAFAGTSSAIKKMIDSIKTSDPFYTFNGGIFGAIVRHLCRRYTYYQVGSVSRVVDSSTEYFDFNPETWDSDELQRTLHHLSFDDRACSSDSSNMRDMILADRGTKDPLILNRTEGRTPEKHELAEQILFAVRLMNDFDSLNSVIAAAKVYLSYPTALAEFPNALNFYLEFSKKFYLYSHASSVCEKMGMLRVFQQLDVDAPSGIFQPHCTGAHEIHKIVYKIAQTTIYQEIGPIDKEVSTFGKTLSPALYEDVLSSRSKASAVKNELASREPQTFFITVASEMTSGLHSLLASAHIAGVIVDVVGLGRQYTDYTQKIVWYLESLLGVNTSLSISDDDIVVLIDAYDVLLFPAARRIRKSFSEYNTPIVFCSENGIYPEFAAPWHYRDSGARHFNSYNQGTQRFLNSGCIAGKAKEVREMLMAVTQRNEIFRDDQQVFVRYLIENPHLVSVDVDRKLFLTGYKEPLENFAISSVLGLAHISKGLSIDHGSIALIHCNQKGSNSAYYSVAAALSSFSDTYLQGRDGPALLAAIHSIWDGNLTRASEYLFDDNILLNASFPNGDTGLAGGTNALSSLLRKYIIRHSDKGS